MPSFPEIHVAAGVLQDTGGRILLAKRHADTHQGNLWEFPGGKLEPGEGVEEALSRELQEELNVEITEYRPLIKVTHQYEDRKVILDCYLVTDWQGKIEAMEKQPLAWVTTEQLESYPMPAADEPVVKAIKLPPSYLITPPVIPSAAQYMAGLEQSLKHGLSMVQFRTFECTDLSCKQLAVESLQLCRRYNARMLINGDIELTREISAHGVHLTSRQLQHLNERPMSRDFLVAASCHNAPEIGMASRLKLDFAVLSPVLKTTSHPDADPLGWQRFAELVELVNLPVYSLGGMQPDLLETAWGFGAQGIAGITCFQNPA